jgi:hypothetical protein
MDDVTRDGPFIHKLQLPHAEKKEEGAKGGSGGALVGDAECCEDGAAVA